MIKSTLMGCVQKIYALEGKKEEITTYEEFNRKHVRVSSLAEMTNAYTFVPVYIAKEW